jgi:sigma-B regulation protein RsbU (phosphoserine phosphatase)
MFGADDVGFLASIASQIAICLENGRLARMEVSRREMEKEMELTSAVQKMFLPKETSFQVSKLHVQGFYRPAVKCGGDWWWYQVEPDGRLYTVVGDVTGHGANAAMITAAVASCFSTLGSRIASLTDLLTQAHATLFSIVKGEYYMTALGVEVNAEGTKMRCLSAAAPTVFVVHQDATTEKLFGGPSTPVGFNVSHMKEGFTLSEFSLDLKAGDRIYLMTDGIAEQALTGNKQLGERRLGKMLVGAQNLASDQVVRHLMTEIDGLRGEEPQGDDFTLVMIEVH